RKCNPEAGKKKAAKRIGIGAAIGAGAGGLIGGGKGALIGGGLGAGGGALYHIHKKRKYETCRYGVSGWVRYSMRSKANLRSIERKKAFPLSSTGPIVPLGAYSRCVVCSYRTPRAVALPKTQQLVCFAQPRRGLPRVRA